MDICFQEDGDETRRDSNPHSVPDIFHALNENQRCRKSDNVDTALICPASRRIQLLTTKTNIVKNHGYSVKGINFLLPEEALFFLETLKLEILLEKIPLSIERGRSLLLSPDKQRAFDGTTCGFSEYTVYKYLARQGYRLRRPNFVISRLQGSVDQKERVAEESSSATVEKDISEEVQAMDVSGSCPEGIDSAAAPVVEGLEVEGQSEDIELLDENGVQALEESQSSDPATPLGAGKRKWGNTTGGAAAANNIADNSGPGAHDVFMGKRAKFKLGEDPEVEGASMDNSPASKKDSSDSDMSPEIICDYECTDDSSSVKVTYYSQEGQETIYELDEEENGAYSPSKEEPQPSTSKGPAGNYTVQEVDSDVEFVDEVIFSGVEIEELVESEEEVEEEEELPDLPEIPGPSTSSKPPKSFTTIRSPTKSHVFVDLVSSDDDEEDGSSGSRLKDYSAHIWSQFNPNSKATKLGFPPAELIPEGIRRPSKEPLLLAAESYLKTDEECELELKEIVDGLKLDSDTPDNTGSCRTFPRNKTYRNRAKSWTDWRQQETKEIREIFHSSLFGAKIEEEEEKKSALDCDNHSKINCWPTTNATNNTTNNNNNNNNNMEINSATTNNSAASGAAATPPQTEKYDNSYSYDLYLPSENKYSKNLLGTQVRPSYRIIIKQETDVFLDFNQLSTAKDQVPFLIAVVNEDQDVTFVSPGNKAIHDLFQSSKP